MDGPSFVLSIGFRVVVLVRGHEALPLFVEVYEVSTRRSKDARMDIGRGRLRRVSLPGGLRSNGPGTYRCYLADGG